MRDLESQPSSTRFKPGNTYGKGRAVGSKSKAQVAIEAIGLEDCVAVMRKAIERALAGDVSAMKLILDRVYPVRKGVRMKLDLPRIETYGDFLKASNRIIHLMAQGMISTQEAMELSHVYSRTLAMWDVVDLSILRVCKVTSWG
jgi:hypothetical protein